MFVHLKLLELIFSSSTQAPLVMGVLNSVKNFSIGFSPNLHVLRYPKSKKVVFRNLPARMCVCASECNLLIIKSAKVKKQNRRIKFYLWYRWVFQMVKIENQKWMQRTVNTFLKTPMKQFPSNSVFKLSFRCLFECISSLLLWKS